MAKSRAICEAFALIADLVILCGADPLSKFDNCWEYTLLDDRWFIAVNGHKETRKTSEGMDVEPFTCFVKFNFWPFALFTPYGGSIMNGEIANESTFIKALKKTIAQKTRECPQ